MKPTTLSSQLQRNADEETRANAREDAVAASAPVEEGFVFVRLIRPHYDAENVMHMPGIVKLRKGKVPESAIKLSGKDAAEAASNDLREARKVVDAQTSEPGERVNDDFARKAP